MSLLVNTPEVSSWEYFELQHQRTEPHLDAGPFLTKLTHI